MTTKHTKAIKHLACCDTRLAAVIKSIGKYRIEMRKEPFPSLVEAIIYQQLAGSAADAIYGRFIQIYGKFPLPQQILSTPEKALRSAGLSGRKIEYIKDLAARVHDGRLRLDLLSSMTDEEIIGQLVEVKGIGRWTAEMFLIFCLGRPDILPVGDLGLQKAVQKVYSLSALPTRTDMMSIAEPWKPYRSVATWYLWKSLAKFKAIG